MLGSSQRKSNKLTEHIYGIKEAKATNRKRKINLKEPEGDSFVYFAPITLIIWGCSNLIIWGGIKLITFYKFLAILFVNDFSVWTDGQGQSFLFEGMKTRETA